MVPGAIRSRLRHIKTSDIWRRSSCYPSTVARRTSDMTITKLRCTAHQPWAICESCTCYFSIMRMVISYRKTTAQVWSRSECREQIHLPSGLFAGDCGTKVWYTCDARDYLGRAPLHSTLDQRHLAIIRLLLEYAHPFMRRTRGVRVQSRNHRQKDTTTLQDCCPHTALSSIWCNCDGIALRTVLRATAKFCVTQT
ncbi:hypothetical protein BJV78DRAFT_739879 [Lactifluus subvellereus]|nr:hypothetical protein BJV78DRAFT_739879 [Lactifluus subvellereus]